MRGVVEDVRPRVALVMDFVRDQLDRYGEVDTIVRQVGDALASQPDDDRRDERRRPVRGGTCAAGAGSRRLLRAGRPRPPGASGPLAGGDVLPALRARARVPHALLRPERRLVLPRLRPCRDPRSTSGATDIELTSRSSAFSLRGGEDAQRVELPVPALYNVYNALAAAAAARVSGATGRAVADELDRLSGRVRPHGDAAGRRARGDAAAVEEPRRGTAGARRRARRRRAEAPGARAERQLRGRARRQLDLGRRLRGLRPGAAHVRRHRHPCRGHGASAEVRGRGVRAHQRRARGRARAARTRGATCRRERRRSRSPRTPR